MELYWIYNIFISFDNNKSMTDKRWTRTVGRTLNGLSKIEHVKCQLSVTDERCTVHYYLTGAVVGSY